MALRCEVWTRPGDPSFGRIIADLPVISHTFTERRNGIGDGTFTLPDSYPRLSEIMDSPDGASYGGVSSLIRVFDDNTLIHEAIPTAMIPSTTVGDHIVTFETVGIGAILGYSRLEPFDWTGADSEISLFPDWKFSAVNLVPDNGTFDTLGVGAVYALYVADESYTLSITATGGTFTLSIGGNTSASIAYNVTAGSLETAIEAITGVTDCEVDGQGTVAEPFRIMFVDPDQNYTPDLTVNVGSLTGGSATVTKVADGFARTGTTFTLTVNGQTTGNIAHNATTVAVENALQALSTVAEVTVEGGGTYLDPWVIVFVDPLAPTTFTADNTGLSGGTTSLTETDPEETSFGRWTASQFADQRKEVASHGALSLFRLIGDTIAGIGAVTVLEFKASLQFGGVQTIVPVTNGSTGQASVWLKSSSSTDRYRWILRSVVDELDNPIAGYPSIGGEFTLAANTWTQIDLSNVSIPTNVEEMIFRVAYVGTTEPQAGTMRVYGATFYEGLAPGTIGYTLRTLYEDMVDDHGSGVDLYWDNGAGTPYLTLDFSDTVDSASQTWDDSELPIDFLHEQSLLNAASTACNTSGPYERRVTPNSVTAGTWLLQVFNAGGDPAWDLSADDDCPVVRGGKDTTARSVRRFLPDATDVAVEGDEYAISRARNTAAVAALGRIGGYVVNRELPDLAGTTLAAQTELAVRLANSTSLTYRVIPDETRWRPLVDYLPGYTILVEDEPLVSKSAHIVDAVRVRYGASTPTEYEVHFDSESFVGSEALAEGVRRLLAVFKGVRPDKTGGAGRRGGGLVPYLVAASDTSDDLKAVAGYVCDGTNDEDEIQACLNANSVAVLAPGSFAVESVAGGSPIVVDDAELRGMSHGLSYIYQSDSGKSAPGPLVRVLSFGSLHNVQVEAVDCTAVLLGENSIGTDLMTYTDTGSYALDVGGGGNETKAHNVRATGGKVRIYSNDATFSDFTIEDGDLEIYSCNGFTGSNIVMIGGGGGSAGRIYVTTTFMGRLSNIGTSDGLTDDLPVMFLEDCVELTINGASVNIGQDGIVLDGCTRCTLIDVTVDGAGSTVAANTYDGIRLQNGSSYNRITQSTVVPSDTANTTRYGINVVDGTCECNRIYLNDIGDPADYGTDALNDAGYLTQLDPPSDPTYGSNWTTCAGS